MRKFYLINGNGTTYDLMNTKHWLNQPKGLGVRMGSKYEQVGSNYIRTKKVSKAEAIKGRMMFTGTKQYDNYREFMQFLSVEPLRLVYDPNGTEYQAEIDIDEIEKTEIDNETGILFCDIELKRMTRWRRIVLQRNDAEVKQGKVYPYTYPYVYGKDTANNVTIESDSPEESPCKITIIGACVNPAWRLYTNGELVSTGSVEATLTAGQRIVIDDTQIPYSIKKYDNNNNMIADLYELSDFSTKRFFFLKRGTNRISIGHDGTNTLELAVEARLEYESV